AMRFFHALAAGCVPVIVGGPTNTVPLPFGEFVNYSRFARFARVRNVSDAQELLLELLKAKTIDRTEADQEELLAEIGGLFMKHEGCHWASGQPFLDLLAKSFEARAKIWQHMRWYN
ncbi:unnamed protein product, partial [Durusdinium trenchii]